VSAASDGVAEILAGMHPDALALMREALAEMPPAASTIVSVRVPYDVLTAARVRCAARGETVSDVLRRALGEYVHPAGPGSLDEVREQVLDVLDRAERVGTAEPGAGR